MMDAVHNRTTKCAVSLHISLKIIISTIRLRAFVTILGFETENLLSQLHW